MNLFSYNTPAAVEQDPWGALDAVFRNNPTEIALALSEITGENFTDEPDDLMAWAQDYFQANGHLDPLVRATKGVPIVGYSAQSAAKSSSETGGTWNWGGFLGGVVQGIGVGLQNGFGALTGQPNAQQQEALLEAQRQRNIRNTILTVVGIIAAVVIGVVLIKKYK